MWARLGGTLSLARRTLLTSIRCQIRPSVKQKRTKSSSVAAMDGFDSGYTAFKEHGRTTDGYIWSNLYEEAHDMMMGKTLLRYLGSVICIID